MGKTQRSSRSGSDGDKRGTPGSSTSTHETIDGRRLESSRGRRGFVQLEPACFLSSRAPRAPGLTLPTNFKATPPSPCANPAAVSECQCQVSCHRAPADRPWHLVLQLLQESVNKREPCSVFTSCMAKSLRV
jgi:hypothetical protein